MKKIVSLLMIAALAGISSVASADLQVCGAALVPTSGAGTGNCTITGYGAISAIVSVSQETTWKYSVNLTSTVLNSRGSARLINRGGTFTRDINGALCKEAADTNKSSAVRGAQQTCFTNPIGALHYPEKIRVFLERP